MRHELLHEAKKENPEEMKAKEISQICHERMVLWEHIPIVTPWVIYIEPSGYCNLKCQFCPHGTEGKKLKKDFLTLNIFEKLVDDLLVFPNKVKLLRICGTGEPLLNRDIIRMLQYAQEKKIAERIELITNGILLNTDLIKNLPRFLDRIVISIEGLCSEDYQRICGASINFQNLLDNFDVLYACKSECVIHIKIHHESVFSVSKKTEFFNMFGNRCDEICIEKLVPMWPQLDSDYFVNEIRWGGERCY